MDELGDEMGNEAHGRSPSTHAGGMMSGTAHGDHDRHAGHSIAMFRDKFWLSFALTIPVVLWSEDVQHWFGDTAPSFPGSKLIPAALGTLVFLYGGLVFIRGARRELVDHRMMERDAGVYWRLPRDRWRDARGPRRHQPRPAAGTLQPGNRLPV